jgi:hypothetical protein
MIRPFLNWIAKFFARRTTEKRLFYIDKKQVTEAEWYANGGLEAEEDLERSLAEMKKEFQDWKEFRGRG